MKVFIGVGHGGKDPGACANNMRESDVNLCMALACQEYLLEHGVECKVSRSIDENDKLAEEIRECKAFDPDVSLEIHNNSGGGNGFECYVTSPSDPAYRLAELIEQEVILSGHKSRGIKINKRLGWTNSGLKNAVLTEGFFLDGISDSARFTTNFEQKNLAICYAKGILNFLGVKDYDNEKEKLMKKVADKYNFARDTIVYLADYKYGESLLRRLAEYGN